MCSATVGRNPRFSRKIRSFQARRCGRHLASTEFRPKSTVFTENQVISGQLVWPPPRVESVSAEIHGFQRKSGHFRPDDVAATSRSVNFGRSPRFHGKSDHFRPDGVASTSCSLNLGRNPRFSGKIEAFRARRCGRHLASTQSGLKSMVVKENQVISGQTVWPAPRVHSILAENHVF